MFRASYNRARLRLRIETVTPLLIRASDSGLDPTAAELSCVRTHHLQHETESGKTVYVPGSSLKGVLRSAAESAIREQSYRREPRGPALLAACDPLDRDHACDVQIRREQRALRDKKQDMSTAEVHARHCLACRLFGSQQMKGRATVRDLFPWDEYASAEDPERGPQGSNAQRANQVETRTSVAISRITGAASSNALFEQEMIPAGVSFWGELVLENYQIWQLGLMASALLELDEGFAQLGSSKSRGLGVVRVQVEELLHEQSQRAGTQAMLGVGQLAKGEIAQGYALLPEEELKVEGIWEPRGLFVRLVTSGHEKTWACLEKGLEHLARLEVQT